MHQPALMDVKTTAAFLGLPPRRVYVIAKDLPKGVVVKLGGSLLFHRERLDSFLAAGGHLA